VRWRDWPRKILKKKLTLGGIRKNDQVHREKRWSQLARGEVLKKSRRESGDRSLTSKEISWGKKKKKRILLKEMGKESYLPSSIQEGHEKRAGKESLSQGATRWGGAKAYDPIPNISEGRTRVHVVVRPTEGKENSAIQDLSPERTRRDC